MIVVAQIRAIWSSFGSGALVVCHSAKLRKKLETVSIYILLLTAQKLTLKLKDSRDSYYISKCFSSWLTSNIDTLTSVAWSRQRWHVIQRTLELNSIRNQFLLQWIESTEMDLMSLLPQNQTQTAWTECARVRERRQRVIHGFQIFRASSKGFQLITFKYTDLCHWAIIPITVVYQIDRDPWNFPQLQTLKSDSTWEDFFSTL